MVVDWKSNMDLRKLVVKREGAENGKLKLSVTATSSGTSEGVELGRLEAMKDEQMNFYYYYEETRVECNWISILIRSRLRECSVNSQRNWW